MSQKACNQRMKLSMEFYSRFHSEEARKISTGLKIFKAENTLLILNMSDSTKFKWQRESYPFKFINHTTALCKAYENSLQNCDKEDNLQRSVPKLNGKGQCECGHIRVCIDKFERE